MASTKKGKKNKGKTLALQDFLQETPGVVPSIPIRKSTLNWADEVEDNHDVYDSRSAKASVVLPTAPKASRDFEDITDKVPEYPPYIAYLSSLPYDVDESEIAAFFKNLKIANMRIPKDERPGEPPKLKGFGYVEFEDRDSLLQALVIPDTTIKNRRIRIEVSTGYDNKNRSGRSDMSRDRTPRSDVSSGDWRSGPRQESSEGGERRGGFNRDNRDRERDRDRDESSGAWRSNREPERDRGFSRPSDRFSRDDRDQEFSRSRGDRDRDRDRDDRGFMSRRYDGERGGAGGRSGGFSRIREDQESNKSSAEPRQRPKLVLAPRTKPVEAEAEAKSTSASIFGNAKPVDTSARERQIEERLARDSEPPPKRELSEERREQAHDSDNLASKDNKEKERPQEYEKKIIERSSHNPKSDANGIVEKTHISKKNGDHEKKDQQKSDVGDKPKIDKKREEKRERPEKEMPKLKQVEAPNFIANNKFAFLETEDSD